MQGLRSNVARFFPVSVSSDVGANSPYGCVPQGRVSWRGEASILRIWIRLPGDRYPMHYPKCLLG